MTHMAISWLCLSFKRYTYTASPDEHLFRYALKCLESKTYSILNF